MVLRVNIVWNSRDVNSLALSVLSSRGLRPWSSMPSKADLVHVLLGRGATQRYLLNISCTKKTWRYLSSRVAGLDSKLSKPAAHLSSMLTAVTLPLYCGGGCNA